MLRTSLLLVAFSLASYECATSSDGSDTGNPSGLRDWVRNMKGRMSNRESNRGLMGSFDLNNLPKMKLPSTMISRITGERKFQPVNLANVKFDPSMDRAYRMGNWYVIRRRSSNKDDSADDWEEFFGKSSDKWEVVNNGVQRVDDTGAKCLLWQPTASTSKTESDEAEELSAEVINSALLRE
ncbi:uncharacterized protein LOC131669993 [Phymastichus coffea]|uniref:uncharacterized protein LOC131669993 n=1 Tax=Phymastichus coffea TaxID=108790 RepID=UPI00273CBF7C|nr:uncharacterized protein LOC131669993 [Phymastichus coffea]